MALSKESNIDQIMINRDAVFHIRVRLEIFEDTTLLMERNFRFTLEPGDVINDRFAQINATLLEHKAAAIPNGQRNRVGSLTQVLWTAGVIQAWQEKKAAQDD